MNGSTLHPSDERGEADKTLPMEPRADAAHVQRESSQGSPVADEAFSNLSLPSRSCALTQSELINLMIRPQNGEIYIIRGVALAEAQALLNGAEIGEGRVRGRESYGISNPEIIPGFVVSHGLKGGTITPDQMANIIKDAAFYATDKGPGKIVIFELPKETVLNPQRSAKVAESLQVVAIPDDAKVVGAIEPPLRIDPNTGLPLYPADPVAMIRELEELEHRKVLKLDEFVGLPYVENEAEIDRLARAIIDKHHGLT